MLVYLFVTVCNGTELPVNTVLSVPYAAGFVSACSNISVFISANYTNSKVSAVSLTAEANAVVYVLTTVTYLPVVGSIELPLGYAGGIVVVVIIVTVFVITGITYSLSYTGCNGASATFTLNISYAAYITRFMMNVVFEYPLIRIVITYVDLLSAVTYLPVVDSIVLPLGYTGGIVVIGIKVTVLTAAKFTN